MKSSVDQRAAARAAAVARLVASRVAQGFPEGVEDPIVLRRIAAIVAGPPRRRVAS